MENKILSISQAVSLRTSDLLKERKMSQYRLEKNSGISHSLLNIVMKNRNNSVNFKTIVLIASGFDMSVVEFLDCEYFNLENLDID